jgi:hypothetical protein
VGGTTIEEKHIHGLKLLHVCGFIKFEGDALGGQAGNFLSQDTG